ncbi:hypothetical protein XH93_10565 [Bradyrhizobium sp. CCBAU 51753]|nr:hypothetical protein XH93_10565 [Bradyrhizobium sp. CCBAU 51753]
MTRAGICSTPDLSFLIEAHRTFSGEIVERARVENHDVAGADELFSFIGCDELAHEVSKQIA